MKFQIIIPIKIMIIMKNIGRMMFGEPVPSIIGGKGKIQMKPPTLPVTFSLVKVDSETKVNPTTINVMPKKKNNGNNSRII